ncbi:MAG: site-2 protease family protein [Spirochaetota bacterium]
MVLTILLGLLGLGIIIFIHESGHFAAAKAFGIEVESFALGWGRRVAGFTRGGTEYRINIFPIGGYCRMKGEDDFKTAVEQRLPAFPRTEGSLFSVSAGKRFVTYLAGPLSNLLFAVLLFSVIWYAGYEYQTYSNKVVLASDYPELYGSQEETTPAEQAGLQTGDEIISIDGQTVSNFSHIQEALIGKAQQQVTITYQRDGREFQSELIPELNVDTGAGVIGIAAWIEPEIQMIPEDSHLSAYNIKAGDRIVACNDHSVSHALDLTRCIRAADGREITLEIEREGRTFTQTIPLEYNENGQPVFNAAFPRITASTPDYSLFGALGQGITETFSQLKLAVHSISLLFKGLNAQEAMAGPLKITYLLGDTASQSFSAGIRTGLITVMQLLGFISTALAFANLLPIPALDGGQMILSVWEAVTRRPVRPIIYYRLQIIGFALLFSLLLFTVFSDVSFFLR